MATLATLRTAVGTKSGMDYSNAGFERDLIDFWLNEGVREVLTRTHCYVKCADLTLSNDVWKYDLPANILALKSIVDTESNRVEMVTLDEILDLRRSSTTGATTNLRVAITGLNLLTVWPTPTQDIEIDVFYVPLPAEMTTTTDDPSVTTFGGIPTAYHHAIELFALAQASDHEHEGRTQQGRKYTEDFEFYIKKVIRPAVNRMGGRLPQVSRGRRTRVISGNGIYP